MKITKQIIDGFVSYIDLKDIQEFVKKHPKPIKKDKKEEQKTSSQKL